MIRDRDIRSGTQPQAAVSPAHMLAAHRVGRIELAVANNGTFGREYHPGEAADAFTGDPIPFSCQYPKGSQIAYLFGGAFWIGAVMGGDTLVSVGADGWQHTYEMFPAPVPFGKMQHYSMQNPEDSNAVSEEDYISVYTDTFPELVAGDPFSAGHIPLNVEVTQASYAWSYEYAEDFVLFDYKIRNIGRGMLRQVYMGIYVDAMICYDCFGSNEGYTDDHSGFLQTYPVRYGQCEFPDTVYIAWQADDDGDLETLFSDGRLHPCPHAVATRIVRTPADELDVSFNWWISNGNTQLDFGPRERSNVGQWQEPVRDFGTGGLGTPEGDRNKYYVLRNQEFDYDQIFTAAISSNDPLWLYPEQSLAEDYADGFDTRYLLSFGPFDIAPGQSLPISFAYLAGENLHRTIGNAENLPGRPDLYYDNLDFSDLALNSTWASWVYDNPGVDTDGNGFFGKYRLQVTHPDGTVECLPDGRYIGTGGSGGGITEARVDTIWYQGDGVPDFRGAAPPPPPEFRLESPGTGMIRVQLNGQRSETTKDRFSGIADFEGYRIYIARDNREASFSLIASYDREDFNKYVWNAEEGAWLLYDPPFTLETLQCLYADSCGDTSFDPLRYTRLNRFAHPDYPESLFYFEKQDFNASGLGEVGVIAKSYPDQPYPSHLNPDSARPEELTPEGRLKYFEYEYTISGLLPSVPYWVNVTAFDFGSPKTGLPALESSVTDRAQSIFTVIGDASPGDEMQVIVFPNPYRVDGRYRGDGFEGRLYTDRPDDRVRAVHFANLPAKCTIRIYTLDGDLVREIVHNEPPGSARENHDEWNLITRNTQMVVSGLYYWTVEAPDGRVQMGKLAIVM